MDSLEGVGLNLRLEFIDEVVATKPDIPFFEVVIDNWLSPGPHHEKLEKIRKDYDLFFHCVGMNITGYDSLDFEYLNRIKELKDIFQPVHLSDHLCFSKHNNEYYYDLLPFPYSKKNLKNTVTRVDEIQDFFKESILLENLSYYLDFKDSEMDEFDFLNQLCQKTGALQILDVNNLWVNQMNSIQNIDNIIAKVNFSNIKEIHVAGAEKLDAYWVDTHGADVNSEVIDLTREIKKKITVPVIYERDSNIPKLEDLLNTVQNLEGL